MFHSPMTCKKIDSRQRRTPWLVATLLIAAWSLGPCVALKHAAGQSSLIGSWDVSLVTATGMPRDIVERGAAWNFGSGALQTYRGWQYAAFWDDQRQVSVARRSLPDGPWQCVSLSGYQRTSNVNRGKAGRIARGFGDGHEKVAMGISRDGVIHLAFDHHVSTLHYRFSEPGLANRPSEFVWSEDRFGEVQDHLGGPVIDQATYPSFVRDGRRLCLYLRLNGGSGNADSHFFEYQDGRWVINDVVSSKLIDRNWSGGNGTVNAYPHAMKVHQGRRHLTWCWRDTPDARTCHDLCYAYSDDQGMTWNNHAGEVVAERGSRFIHADSPGITVLQIPPGSRFVNGGSMTVDEAGDVFVLMRGPDGQPMSVQSSGSKGESADQSVGVWTRRFGHVLGLLVTAGPRRLIVGEDGLYQVGPDPGADAASETLLQIAPPIVTWCDDSRFEIDHQRLVDDQTISVIGQVDRNVHVLDFKLKRP